MACLLSGKVYNLDPAKCPMPIEFYFADGESPPSAPSGDIQGSGIVDVDRADAEDVVPTYAAMVPNNNCYRAWLPDLFDGRWAQRSELNPPDQVCVGSEGAKTFNWRAPGQ